MAGEAISTPAATARPAIATHSRRPAFLSMPNWSPTSAQPFSAAYNGTGALLDLQDSPTAIFCSTTVWPWLLTKRPGTEGLHVPHDLSIAGFDNDPFVTAFLPSLTTAVLPHEAMARWAVQHIFDVRHTRVVQTPEQHRLKCQLVRRKSIAKPRNSMPRLNRQGLKV